MNNLPRPLSHPFRSSFVSFILTETDPIADGADKDALLHAQHDALVDKFGKAVARARHFQFGAHERDQFVAIQTDFVFQKPFDECDDLVRREILFGLTDRLARLVAVKVAVEAFIRLAQIRFAAQRLKSFSTG